MSGLQKGFRSNHRPIWLSRLFYFSLFLFTIVCFQNCSQGFQSTVPTDNSDASDVGAVDAPPSNEDPAPLKVTPPQSILFIGNSFTYTTGQHPYNNLPDLVRNLFINEGILVSIDLDTYPDAYFKSHLSRPSVRSSIESKKFEVVVFQGHSTEAEFPENMKQFGMELINLAKNADVNSVLFMTWNRADRSSDTFSNIISIQYNKLGSDNSVPVAPIGLAWEIFKKENPSVNLYLDNRHANAIGSYIAAATFYSFFTGKTSVGLKYIGVLDSKDAAAAQRAAWQAIQQHNQFYVKSR